MSEETALDLLEELKDSIVKQWGEIPVEISNELSALEEAIIGKPEEPVTENPDASETR